MIHHNAVVLSQLLLSLTTGSNSDHFQTFVQQRKSTDEVTVFLTPPDLTATEHHRRLYDLLIKPVHINSAVELPRSHILMSSITSKKDPFFNSYMAWIRFGLSFSKTVSNDEKLLGLTSSSGKTALYYVNNHHVAKLLASYALLEDVVKGNIKIISTNIYYISSRQPLVVTRIKKPSPIEYVIVQNEPELSASAIKIISAWHDQFPSLINNDTEDLRAPVLHMLMSQPFNGEKAQRNLIILFQNAYASKAHKPQLLLKDRSGNTCIHHAVNNKTYDISFIALLLHQTYSNYGKKYLMEILTMQNELGCRPVDVAHEGIQEFIQDLTDDNPKAFNELIAHGCQKEYELLTLYPLKKKEKNIFLELTNREYAQSSQRHLLPYPGIKTDPSNPLIENRQ